MSARARAFRTSRWILAGVAFAAGAAGLWLALSSFDAHIALDDLAPGSGGDLVARCDAPVVSAWQSGDKDQLAAWVVDVRTNMSPVARDATFRTVLPAESATDPWCGDQARPRLVIALAVAALAVAAVIWLRRTETRSIDAVEVPG